jgi:hypothetical protein
MLDFASKLLDLIVFVALGSVLLYLVIVTDLLDIDMLD